MSVWSALAEAMSQQREDSAKGQNYCQSCGLPIPQRQNTCSMCYGDIEHGSDGYYRAWAEGMPDGSEGG